MNEKLVGFDRDSSDSTVQNPMGGTATGEFISMCPAILEQIFKSLDLQRLKSFRLVCKEWNSEICRSIRSIVTFGYEYQNPREFLQLLDTGKELQLRSPFKSLHVSLMSQKPPHRLCHFRQLLVRIPITKLTLLQIEINWSPQVTEYVVNLLRLSSESLTCLKTQYWEVMQDFPGISFKLPRLKRLVLKHYLNDNPVSLGEELAFFQALIVSAPNLKQLKMKELNCIPELLRTANLESIKELNIYLTASNDDIWRRLSLVKIFQLKKLTMQLYVWNPELLTTAISRFSHSLEYLKFSATSIETLPLCPKLTHLELSTLGDLNSAALPKLQVLKFRRLELNLWGRDHAPFLNVCSVETGLNFHFGFEEYSKEEKRIILSQFFRGFPNAKSWSVPYTHLEEFIQAACLQRLNVQRLVVNLNLSEPRARIRNPRTALAADRQAFSNLRLLPDLNTLELYNDDTLPDNTNINVEAIDFKRLPSLKSLRHVGRGLTNYLALKEHLQSLDSVMVVILQGSSWFATEDKQMILNQMPNLQFVSGSRSLCTWK